MKKHFDSQGRPKKGFATQAEAEKFRRYRIASGAWRASDTNTYYDPWCGEYHAGRLGRNHRGKGRQPRKKAAPRWYHTQ